MLNLKFLVWGANGWIGNQVVNLLKKEGYEVIAASARLEQYEAILEELKMYQPNRVMNLAGIAGRPTVDWCEDHQAETYMANTIGADNLARACSTMSIHLTYYGTGCIYTYDDKHPFGSFYTEDDAPNFFGSTYSCSKIMTEKLLSFYDNVLILRIRLPISGDMHPKDLISKLSKYNKLIDIPNSITILPELLPISVSMSIAEITGIFNLVNPGVISHNQLMTMYKNYVDPSFTWTNFTEAEQNAILKSKRSNCALDTTKLVSYHPVTEVRVALENIFKNLQK